MARLAKLHNYSSQLSSGAAASAVAGAPSEGSSSQAAPSVSSQEAAAAASDAAAAEDNSKCRLFVGNLLSSVDEEELHDVFGLFGEVQELQVRAVRV